MWASPVVLRVELLRVLLLLLLLLLEVVGELLELRTGVIEHLLPLLLRGAVETFYVLVLTGF